MPKRSLTFSENEVADIIREHVAKSSEIDMQSGIKVRFNVAGGLSGNDPRERNDAHLVDVRVDLP